MRTLLLLFSASVALAGGGPQNVVVLVNETSPDSQEVAKYYVEKRHIPTANVLRLKCPTDHTVDLATYQATIERPLRRFLHERGLADQIDFLVLCQGMPLRVNIGGEMGGIIAIGALMELMDTPLATDPQEKHTTHANPYNGQTAFHHAKAYGGSHLYLVTHLAACNAADVKRMIDSSVASDGTAPNGGFWFQDADGNASGRNPEYDPAILSLQQKGFTAEHVKSGADALIGKKDVMGYMSGGCYSHLDRAKIHQNTYRPGSIVDMLESFGAVPENFNSASPGSQFPVTWFLDAGVAGIQGAVQEPFSDAFPSGKLFERYTEGYNLAETFYGTLPFVHWMNLVDGDPLCQPYATRPEVAAQLPKGEASGTVTIHARSAIRGPAGAKVARVELCIDGRRVATADGGEADLAWDTTKCTNGRHEVLVAAIDSSPMEVQEQTFLSATVNNPSLRVISTSPADGGTNVALAGPYEVRLNRAVTRAEGVALADEAGAAVATKEELANDGMSVLLKPNAPLKSGRKYRITIPAGLKAKDGEPLPAAVSWTFTTTARSLALSMPTQVQAGEPFAVKITAKDDDGKALPHYDGFLNVTSSDPSAQTLKFGQEFGKRDSLTVSCTLRSLGRTTVTAIDPDSGAKGETSVEVIPGPIKSLAIIAPPGGIPRGTPVPILVAAMDAAGNPVPGYTGTVKLTCGAGGAVLPAAHAFEMFERGRHSFARAVFPNAGEVTLTATDGSGATGTEKLTVKDGGIREWLWIGALQSGRNPAIDTDEIGNDAGATPVAGQVVKPRRWTPLLSGGDGVDLTAAMAKETGTAYAVVYIESPREQDAQLWFGCENVVRVFWNGLLFHRVDKRRGNAEFADHIQMLHISKGMNRLMVKLLHDGGGVRFSAKICDDKGTPLDDLTYSAYPKGAPPRLTLAGCVRTKGQGVPNISVTLAGAEKLTATTLGDGRFEFTGLTPGPYTLKPLLPKITFDPETLKVTLADADVLDAVFEPGDATPPAAKLVSPKAGTKVAGLTPFTAEATDDVGIRSVRFLLDGEAIAPPVMSEPFTANADLSAIPAGTHELTVEAEDFSGNRFVTRPEPITVVLDKTPPLLQIASPTGEESVRGRIELTPRVADDVAVATVQWYIDDQPVGAAVTAPPYAATWTPDRKAKGKHTVKAVAKDTAGNAAEAQVLIEVR